MNTLNLKAAKYDSLCLGMLHQKLVGSLQMPRNFICCAAIGCMIASYFLDDKIKVLKD